MTELVHLGVAAGVATITLDSPANRNALSAEVRGDLAAHLATAIDDDSIRVIVLGHSGPVFCAGLDLKEVAAGGADRAVGEIAAVLERIWTSPTPVVAALAGPARAGGVGLLAAADVVVAALDVTFAFTEVRLGVTPAVISATLLPRMLPHAAHELFLTGEVFDAARAAAIGLVNSAVPAERLDAEVRRYVDALLLAAPGAVASTKQLLRSSIAEELSRLGALSAASFAGDEAREGMLAFAEKRPPQWAAPTGAPADGRSS
ncbi:MAG: enoyl-CoA hydratase/isomerase family protein [Pseudonocardiales bacterium]|nr:enoyl-CoA hydratase/isomerase family protein [Pseudonocardiales bacterium]